MEHACKFKLIGGGCMVIDTKELPCNSHYKCECGKEFRTKENQETHFVMPLEIIGKEPAEPIKVNIPELDTEKKDN